MSKKKTRKPNIDPRVLARPRLDALFDRHARGELDLDGLHAETEKLLAEVGYRPLLDALVRRMEGTPEAERETLMLLVERLRRPEVVEYLWQQVKKPGALSVEAKMTALIILKSMGENVDVADPGRYFSPHEIKPGAVKSVEKLFQMGMRGMARHLREARDPVEVERLMMDINRMPENAIDGDNIVFELVASAEADASDLGADFLHVLAHATPDDRIRKTASEALARLAARGIKPVTPVILRLGQETFHAAYMTDPNHPWQQSVNVAWERAPGVVQALVFLLDFGLPWGGAIKDVWATQPLSPEQYYNHFAEAAQRKMGERVYRVPLTRAQSAIAAAVEANRKNKVPLAKEFNELRHLVERWVLRPPESAVLADSSPDELAGHPPPPDRSQQPLVLGLRGPKGKEALEILSRQAGADISGAEFASEEEFDDEGFLPEADEFYDFDNLLDDVATIHEELKEPVWWQGEWVQEYLTSLSDTPDELERFDEEFEYIVEHWLWLRSFLVYLDDHGPDVHSVTDLRGFHFSEYLAEEADMDEDGGRCRAEVFRGFFNFLAHKGAISKDTSCLPDLNRMLARPEAVSLLERPRPLGGEIAVWARLYHEDDSVTVEPLNYNEWWAVLMLEKKFKGNLDKTRREVGKKPDAAAKLALLERLESLLTIDPDYLDCLNDDRPPEQEDYARAERWFEREIVNHACAW